MRFAYLWIEVGAQFKCWIGKVYESQRYPINYFFVQMVNLSAIIEAVNCVQP